MAFTFEQTLVVDLETRSTANLKKSGAARYARDPNSEVIAAAWCLVTPAGAGPIQAWHLGQGGGFPEKLRELLVDPLILVICHNSGFDGAVLRHVQGIDIEPDRLIDSAGLAACLGLPRGLDKAAEIVGTTSRKDPDGHAIMLKLCRPRRLFDKGALEDLDPDDDPEDAEDLAWWTPEDVPEDFERLSLYNIGDVKVTLELVSYLRSLPPPLPIEARLQRLTDEMNERGVRIDVENVEKVRLLVNRAKRDLAAAFREMTGCDPTQNAKVRAYLGAIDPRCAGSLAKGVVDDLLADDDLNPVVRSTLSMLSDIQRTSVAKIESMTETVCYDDRIRGGFTYMGAGRTGRWSSSSVQLQNLPRGGSSEDPEALIAGIDAMDAFSGDAVLGRVVDLIRALFVGPFIISDLRQIEARVAAWMAGEKELLAALADPRRDVYKETAAAILKMPLDAVGKRERSIGKTAVLSLNFGSGHKVFAGMVHKASGITLSMEEAKTIVNAYRARYPKIPRAWYAAGDALIAAVSAGKQGTIKVRGFPLVIGRARRAVYSVLPSGRRLYYWIPSMAPDAMGRPQVAVAGFSVKNRTDLWGGDIFAHAVQGTARDIIAEAMLRLDGAGFRPVMSVHDEVVCEEPDDSRLEEMHRLMTVSPTWASDLPLAAETTFTTRYKK